MDNIVLIRCRESEHVSLGITKGEKEGKGMRMKTDIAVAGGGAGGLAAALAAAQMGKKVIVFEKGDRIGGVARGGQGPFAVNTLQQRRLQRIVTEEEAFHCFMDFTHWQSDPSLVAAFINKSADTIHWLEDTGCVFDHVIAYIHGGNHTWHVRDPKSGFITDNLYNKAKELGVEVFLNTAVKELKKTGNAVTGLTAQAVNGEMTEVEAGAVIIATGGFASNPEMVKKYTRFELNKTLNYWDKNLDGDGLRMAWEAGASQGKMFFDSYVGLLPNHLGGPGGCIAPLRAFRQPNLMVNSRGKRFTDEAVMGNGSYASNVVQNQPGMYAYMILTDSIVEDYIKDGYPFALPSEDPFTGKFEDWPTEFRECIEKEVKNTNDLFIAQSIEDLAKQTGLDCQVLQDTVEKYNQICDNGRDDQFHKKRIYLKPIRGQRIYGARMFSGGYGTLGGLNINEKAQVLDEKKNPIKGLFAAGNDANTVCYDTYMFAMPGLTSGFAYNSGRIAGENAADSIENGKGVF